MVLWHLPCLAPLPLDMPLDLYEQVISRFPCYQSAHQQCAINVLIIRAVESQGVSRGYRAKRSLSILF